MSPSLPASPRTGPRFPCVSGDEPNDQANAKLDAMFSRVSGDEPWTAEGAQKHTTFSPHERG